MIDLIVGLGLVLVIEGLLWAAFPRSAARMLERTTQIPETTLRLTALVVAVVGFAIVAIARS